MAHGAVQDCKEQDGQRSEHHVEGSGGDVIHHGLAGEAAVELVVEQDEAKRDVLVEGVLDEARQPVCAQRPMHEQQPRQEPVPTPCANQWPCLDSLLALSREAIP